MLWSLWCGKKDEACKEMKTTKVSKIVLGFINNISNPIFFEMHPTKMNFKLLFPIHAGNQINCYFAFLNALKNY